MERKACRQKGERRNEGLTPKFTRPQQVYEDDADGHRREISTNSSHPWHVGVTAESAQRLGPGGNVGAHGYLQVVWRFLPGEETRELTLVSFPRQPLRCQGQVVVLGRVTDKQMILLGRTHTHTQKTYHRVKHNLNLSITWIHADKFENPQITAAVQSQHPHLGRGWQQEGWGVGRWGWQCWQRYPLFLNFSALT